MSKKSENFKVKIVEGIPLEKALRKFKRMCDSYGIVRQYRDKEAYKKPSIREKEKSENAEKRKRKAISKGRTHSRKI